MFRTFVFFTLVIIPFICRAQETVEQNDKLANNVTAKYHVLKTDNNTKQGLYQAFYKRKTVIATGMYVNGNKVSTWHYYDPTGKLVQHYNYDLNRLTYEAPKDTGSYKINYAFDKVTTKTDTLTRPVKIGGIFYGYLPYLNAFKITRDFYLDPEQYTATMQLLISPNGRLAECKLLINGKLTGALVESFLITDDILTEEEKSFVPATMNGQNISSIILINCKILPNWRVSIY
jgi:hypothetical protein